MPDGQNFYRALLVAVGANEAVSNEIKHWMFPGVSEAMLDKLERKHRGASYFSELGVYGAQKRDLGSRQVLSKRGESTRRPRNY